MSRRQTNRHSTAPNPGHFTVRPLALAAHLLTAGGIAAVACWAGPALAQLAAPASQSQGAKETRTYNIPAGPLNTVLVRFLAESGVLLSGSTELTQGRSSPGIQGRLTPDAALDALLAGTGLEAVPNPQGRYILRRAMPQQAGTANIGGDAATLATVTVMGRAAHPGDLAEPYAGGQVARGGQLGMLGNKDIMDTPFSQTSYTSQVIQDQQARSIADVAANDPSVRQAWVSGSYTDQFYIRGFAVSASDIAVDGLFGIAPYQYTNTDWVDRVEILKGPNAFLNGMSPSGNVGGTINLIPKHAEDKPITQLTASYMSRGQVGTQLDVGRRFGESGEWGVRFNGTYKNGDTSRDRQSQELGSAFVGLDYRGGRLRASLDAGYQHQDFDSPTRFTYMGAGVEIPKAPNGSNNWEPDWTYIKSKDKFGLLRAEYDLSDNWTAYTSFGARHNDFKGVYGQSTILNSAGDTSGAYYTQPTWNTTYTGQLGLRGRLNTGAMAHEINFGYSSLDSDFGSLFTTLPGTYRDNIYNPTHLSVAPDLSSLNSHIYRTTHLRLQSYAFADTISILNKRVQLTLGGRYQKVITENFNQSNGVQASAYDKHALTPAVGLVVKPWENVSIYASYIEGLQQGPTAPVGSTNEGEVFAPIKSKQAEAGVKVDFGTTGATLSVFQITQPSGVTDPNSLHFSVNGEQRNRGVELNVFGEPYRGVRLLGGIALTDAKMTKTAGGSLDGKHPIGVPPFQANLGAEWDTPFLRGLTLSSRLIHTNGSYIDSTNTRATSAWTRVDVGARYIFKRSEGKNVTLRANIDNVFGKNYWSATQFGMVELGEPRTYRLSATFDF
ncbi:MAG: TonB-dependent receptor [Acidovorax sp.]